MADSSDKKQPLKLRPRAEIIEKLRALYNKEPPLPEIGEKMPDGTIYAGISPTSNKPMFAAATDERGPMTFNSAALCATRRIAGGKRDFRVPDVKEQQVLFDNRNKGALKGTFNTSGGGLVGWYWSSTPHFGTGGVKRRFSDGGTLGVQEGTLASVRCVR